MFKYVFQISCNFCIYFQFFTNVNRDTDLIISINEISKCFIGMNEYKMSEQMSTSFYKCQNSLCLRTMRTTSNDCQC